MSQSCIARRTGAVSAYSPDIREPCFARPVLGVKSQDRSPLPAKQQTTNFLRMSRKFILGAQGIELGQRERGYRLERE